MKKTKIKIIFTLLLLSLFSCKKESSTGSDSSGGGIGGSFTALKGKIEDWSPTPDETEAIQFRIGQGTTIIASSSIDSNGNFFLENIGAPSRSSLWPYSVHPSLRLSNPVNVAFAELYVPSVYQNVVRTNRSPGGHDTPGDFAVLEYIYVDANVTITGTDTTIGENKTTYEIHQQAYKKGWNRIVYKVKSRSGNVFTYVITDVEPANGKWYLH